MLVLQACGFRAVHNQCKLHAYAKRSLINLLLMNYDIVYLIVFIFCMKNCGLLEKLAVVICAVYTGFIRVSAIFLLFHQHHLL